MPIINESLQNAFNQVNAVLDKYKSIKDKPIDALEMCSIRDRFKTALVNVSTVYNSLKERNISTRDDTESCLGVLNSGYAILKSFDRMLISRAGF